MSWPRGQVLDLVDEEGRAPDHPCPTGRGRPGRRPRARPRPGPSTSRSSGRSSSIWRTASAARTASSLSRRAPARSNSRAADASRMAASSSRSSGPVSPAEEGGQVGHQPVVLLVGRPRPRTGPSTARCGRAGTAGPAARGRGTWCPSRSAPETTGAAGRACPGWPPRSGTGRSSGPRCACGPAPPPASATRRPR